jgi:hypothetical protein
MNLRLVAFSAVMSALLGGMFGWTVSYIGQPDWQRFSYESPFYVRLYRSYPLIGAGLGAGLGAAFALISQSARARARQRRGPRTPR